MSGDLRATYRLQLNPDLDFRAALELVPYLKRLGVSHLYLSPSLQAVEGSTHGYDVVDPSSISDELGGEGAFRELAAAGLGVILDIVPNHMGRHDEQNRFWADPELRERFFDVDPVTGRHRRFFDVDDLAAIEVEDPEVFEATHRKVLDLVAEGVVDGLRVDHPDGLKDPAGYLKRLQDAGADKVWVEKILHPSEPLRADWPVTGTVGYEFLNDVAGLWVDPAGEEALTSRWREWCGDDRDFAAYALEAQLEQARGPFSVEVERLLRVHDVDRTALEEALAKLPVYRTYVEPRSGTVAEEDRRQIAASGMDGEIAAMLLLEADAPAEFVERFQQTSPPVTAKGVEDTAFYRYLRLLTLCEVGGDPSRFGVSVADFHLSNAERAEKYPQALLTTMTHDAKRSADARARIGVLSRRPELMDELRAAAGASADGIPGDELWLVLQTLVGVFPIEESRLRDYLQKALREGKRTSNWTEPDVEHERRVADFAVSCLDGPVADVLRRLDGDLVLEGERVALGYALLKLTSPGVPDVYQGDELWALSLVDPDNRRPVDWSTRARALADLQSGAPPVRDTQKLHLTWRALDLRARRPSAFGPASTYRPIEAGPDVCAFTRSDEVLVVAGLRDWEDASIAVPEDLRGAWHDVLRDLPVTLGASATVGELGGSHGLALLERPADD